MIAKRVARYLRVSRSDQDPRLQDDETAALIKARCWELVDTFVDHGFSGSRDRRPELDRLLAAARAHAIDGIVVWKADRLFRSMKHMVNTLDELAALGVDFISATEVFDTTTPQGRLLLHLVSAFGEFERGLVIERTRSGLAAARRRGVQLGRPRAPFDLERARELRRQGRTIREVAADLGVAVGTVHRGLRSSTRG